MKSETIGLPKFLKQLDDLIQATNGKILEDIVVVGALEISNQAKLNAPYLTGTLKRSIHVGGHARESSPGFATKDVGGDYTDVGPVVTTKTNATAKIGTNLVYARRREYEGEKMGYLRRAVDSKKQKAHETMGRAMKLLVEKAAK